MQRQHPFLSLSGLVLTTLLLAGLGLIVWRSGGQAFSPGRLSAVERAGVRPGGFSSHAEFETECAYCHRPLETDQDPLCLACHQELAGEIAGGGIHARFTGSPRCYACHSEHRGRDFHPTRGALAFFDHAWADFSLDRHPAGFDDRPLDCADCHTDRGAFDLDAEKCAACHGREDAAFMVDHVQDFGPDCLACHDGLDTLGSFDHAATDFPLLGRHGEVECAGCHRPSSAQPRSEPRGGGRAVRSRTAQAANSGRAPRFFQPVSGGCQECHDEPPVHRSLFAGACGDCHTPEAWLPAAWRGAPFDHEAAGFSLARHAAGYDRQPLDCPACHLPAQFAAGGPAFDPAPCSDCHGRGEERAAFLAAHRELFGPECLDCHDGRDRLSAFDHQAVFSLEGGHAGPECLDCHTGYDFRRTPRACVECHAEPDLHAGFFGLQCEACHTDAGWVPAQLRLHAFPLDHGRPADSSCTACHTETYTGYTCYTCHEHQPDSIQERHTAAGIPAAELAACTACHPDGR